MILTSRQDRPMFASSKASLSRRSTFCKLAQIPRWHTDREAQVSARPDACHQAQEPGLWPFNVGALFALDGCLLGAEAQPLR